MRQYAFVCIWLPSTYPPVMTSWLKCPLWNLGFSGDDINRFMLLFKCCPSRRSCYIIHLWINDCRNLQFGCSVLLVSFTEVIGHVAPCWLCQFVKLHLLLPKWLHVLLYHFGYCAHHLARFVIFTQIAKLCIYIILISLMLLIEGMCKIA